MMARGRLDKAIAERGRPSDLRSWSEVRAPPSTVPFEQTRLINPLPKGAPPERGHQFPGRGRRAGKGALVVAEWIVQWCTGAAGRRWRGSVWWVMRRGVVWYGRYGYGQSGKVKVGRLVEGDGRGVRCERIAHDRGGAQGSVRYTSRKSVDLPVYVVRQSAK